MAEPLKTVGNVQFQVINHLMAQILQLQEQNKK